MRPKAKAALNRTGFTNQEVSMIGSACNSASEARLALTNGEVILEGGDVPAIMNPFILTSKNTIILTSAAGWFLGTNESGFFLLER